MTEVAAAPERERTLSVHGRGVPLFRLYDPARGPVLYERYLEPRTLAETFGFDAVGVDEHRQNAYGLMPLPAMMNGTVKPFDNVRVRQAIAHAIDRKPLIELGYKDIGEPWFSPVPESYQGMPSLEPIWGRDTRPSFN